jgi:hypothetical protein
MRKWLLSGFMLIPFGLFAQANMDTAVKEKWDTTVVKQFDGSRLHVTCNDNMYINYCETMDGYTIVLDKIGMFEYAKRGRHGDLVPSGTPAKDAEQRTDADKKALHRTQKHLRYTGSKLEALQAKTKRKTEDPVIIKRYKKRKPNP